MVPKIHHFHNFPIFCQFYKKVVLRLSEHGDAIKTQTIKVCAPQSLLANSVLTLRIAKFVTFLRDHAVRLSKFGMLIILLKYSTCFRVQ